MRNRFSVLRTVILTFLAAAPCFAQSASRPSAEDKAKPDERSLAGEPYVIEQLQTKIRFEADGRGQREMNLRVRVQSESAVREFGLLAYPYMASFEDLAVVYTRVRKADGTVVETPASEVQDLDSAVSREAPMYTDQREKHIAIKALGVGDLLEVSLRWTIHDPVAPGHFWYDDDFFQNGICLNEELEINVPRDVLISFTGSSPKPAFREEAGRWIYTFHTSHLKKDEEEEIPVWERNFYGAPPPPVRLSSFASWAEVGAWYGGLQQPRVRVTPGIRAKADELTKGKQSDADKIRAIYDFVATRFRYIGINLGLGRYTPHAAEEVLANRYGDCKDKHTLFAALLEAAGIAAYPALISSGYKIVPAMPSASLFDHLITAIPQGDSYLFLDTTPEVAPFGFLVRELRDRPALVIPANALAKLVRTPADPPFLNREKYEMAASIDLRGTLDGKARLEDRGDPEVLIRMAYRNTAQNQWKDLTQNLVNRLGFGGTVSDVAAAQPESTTDPFWVSYAYHRTDYSYWKEHRITLPFPPLFVLELSEKQKASKESLPLGSPQDIVYEASLKLPEGITPILPGNLERKNDFAEYSATYSFDKGILRGTRHLAMKLREISGNERSAYSAFAKEVGEEQSRFILLTGDFEAESPVRKSQLLLHEGKTAEAVALLEKAAAEDAENRQLMLALGSAYLRVPDEVKAMAEFQKFMGANPDAGALSSVAYQLASTNHRLEEALDYASRAVTETAAGTMKVALDTAKPDDYRSAMSLALVWDTLGLAKFRSGDLTSAEKYLEAAWLLWQHALIGEHLAEVYEREGKKQQATRICRMALAAPGIEDNPGTQEKLEAALRRFGGAEVESVATNRKSFPLLSSGGIELSELRAVKVPLQAELRRESKSATFAIAIENGQKTVQAKFVTGANELRPAAKALATANYRQPFPDETPARILRMGLLSCSKYMKECTLVLLPLDNPILIPPAVQE